VFILNQESIVNKTELSATEVLNGVLTNLYNSYGVKKIELVGPKSVEIADDSDHHRKCTGRMSYFELSVLVINNKTWLLSLGTKSGHYPGSYDFRSDIVALEIIAEDPSEDKMVELFRGSIRDYFIDSLLIATVQGYMAVNLVSILGPSILYQVEEIDENLIAGEVIMRDQHEKLNSTADKVAIYRPEVVNMYADAIVFVLG
jgi:hypothetical protein